MTLETDEEETEGACQEEGCQVLLVGREIFSKVQHKQLLSSHPLAVMGTCTLPTAPQEGTGSASAEQAALEPAAQWCCARAKCAPQGGTLWCSQLGEALHGEMKPAGELPVIH